MNKVTSDIANFFNLIIIDIESFYENSYNIIKSNMKTLDKIIKELENKKFLEKIEHYILTYEFSNDILDYLSDCKTYIISIVMYNLGRHKNSKVISVKPAPDISTKLKNYIKKMANFDIHSKIQSLFSFTMPYQITYNIPTFSYNTKIAAPSPLQEPMKKNSIGNIKVCFEQSHKVILKLINTYNHIYSINPDLDNNYSTIDDYLDKFKFAIISKLPSLLTIGLKIDDIKEQIIYQFHINENYIDHYETFKFTCLEQSLSSKYKKYKLKTHH